MLLSLRSFFSHSAWRLGLVIAVVAVGIGALVGLAGPLIAVGAVLALGVSLLALMHLEIGLWGAVVIIALLPFASVPFKVVFTPTFLDLALGAVVLIYLLQWMTGQRRRLTLTPAHGPIAVFVGLAIFSFVAGKDNGPLTPNLLRQFGELLLNIGLVYVLVDYLSQSQLAAQPGRRRDPRPELGEGYSLFVLPPAIIHLVRVILWGGIATAVLGLVLYFMPTELSNRLLSALAPFGYPAGEVLRYIEDNPENAQRAIATSVDPNVLGGFLAIVGGLLAPQLVARKSLLGPRWVVLGAFGLVVTCLVLTFSRGAMVALALALVGIAAARYRRLLWVLLAGGLLIIFLPVTQEYVARFLEGLQGQDLATQMRLGEYKDAFTLIERYPMWGVGFAGAPEIDIYLGVSSAYLLIASQMGLVGLSVFVGIMAVVYVWAFTQRKQVYANEDLVPLWLGAHAGLLAALAVGVVDYYFFGLSFQPAGAMFWVMVSLCLATTKAGES